MKFFFFYSSFFFLTVFELISSLVIHPNFYKIGEQYIPDKKLIYRHRKNYKTNPNILKTIKSININSLGFRGPEPDSNKQSILILGDSMVYGHGVSQMNTFSQILRSKLELNILNAGVKGYGTDQSLLLLREIIQEQNIKIVIFSFNYNDLYDNVVKRRLEGEGLEIVSHQNFFATSFFWFYQKVFPVLPSRLLQYTFTKGLLLYSETIIRDQMDIAKEKKKIAKTIRVVDKLTVSLGIKSLFLVMPNVNRRLNEFDFLKVLDKDYRLIMPNFDKQEYFIDSDIHFSPAGHRKMANILYKALSDYDVLTN